MGDVDGCPTCGKPVMGRTALLAHLEFSHGVDDPVGHLLALETPDRPAREWKPYAAWGAAAVVVLAVIVGGVVVLGGSSGDADLAAAGVETAAATPMPSTTAAPSTTLAPTTTVPPTTVPPTTAPPATGLDDGTVGVEFRRPFLRDAHVVGCAPGGDGDRYTLGFVLSGAHDIVLGGVHFPDRTGDGAQTVDQIIASGSTAYIDRVQVFDGGGTAHVVTVTPPVYLGGC